MEADLDERLAALAGPEDVSRPFTRLIEELLSRVPEPVVMTYAITLLDGDDPSRYPTALRYLGGAHADHVLGNRDFALWPAVWGARAMQYVWTPLEAADAAALVVEHLADARWRVAEMCAKVVGKRELADGANALLVLATHGLPRVRMQAVRALGMVGEREHLSVLHAALTDQDPAVRRAAVIAMERRAIQLDLHLNDLGEGHLW